MPSLCRMGLAPRACLSPSTGRFNKATAGLQRKLGLRAAGTGRRPLRPASPRGQSKLGLHLDFSAEILLHQGHPDRRCQPLACLSGSLRVFASCTQAVRVSVCQGVRPVARGAAGWHQFWASGIPGRVDGKHCPARGAPGQGGCEGGAPSLPHSVAKSGRSSGRPLQHPTMSA